MGYRDALEDGVEVKNGIYKIPCSMCGEGYVIRTVYSRKRVYTCAACQGLIKKAEKQATPDQEKEKRYKRAVNRIKADAKSLDGYQDAMEKVRKTLHRPGWYGSTEEIMVAIELLHRGVKTIHQQQVGKYRVDFVLPEYKVLLEIDGKPFHNAGTREREGLRDGIILLRMGDGWEMIRIDTDKINAHITRLVPSIETVLEHRKAERQRLKKQ